MSRKSGKGKTQCWSDVPGSLACRIVRLGDTMSVDLAGEDWSTLWKASFIGSMWKLDDNFQDGADGVHIKKQVLWVQLCKLL
jgi:hypothetical protein